MSRIYLASSWRNPYQHAVLSLLREWGHAVYDFRHDARVMSDLEVLGPFEPPATAFAWSEMDPDWQKWTPVSYRYQLQTSQRAAQGYIGDLRGMEWADTCVLCLPCGNSAHIEAGYMKGRGKRLIIYWHINDKKTVQFPHKPAQESGKHWFFEPDLMYLLSDNLCVGPLELKQCLEHGS